MFIGFVRGSDFINCEMFWGHSFKQLRYLKKEGALPIKMPQNGWISVQQRRKKIQVITKGHEKCIFETSHSNEMIYDWEPESFQEQIIIVNNDRFAVSTLTEHRHSK